MRRAWLGSHISPPRTRSAAFHLAASLGLCAVPSAATRGRRCNLGGDELTNTNDSAVQMGAVTYTIKEMQLKTNPSKTFPKMLAGGIYSQRVVCRKPGCRCARGGDLRHGPYCSVIWDEGGLRRKVYIRLRDDDEVGQACAAFRDEQERERRQVRDSQESWRHQLDQLRGCEKACLK